MLDARGGLLPVVGRELERARLQRMLDAARERGGGALVLRGAAGIGKSALLLAAETAAREAGLRVLKVEAVPSETQLPFAALHQLLRPVADRIAGLPTPQAEALRAVFGERDELSPEPFIIALAVLGLLSDVAADAPLLVVLEDVQWLDAATADALAFVARRIGNEPVALIAALRDGFASPLATAQLPELWLEALDDVSAEALLQVHGRELSPSARKTLITESAGNPLALLELPAATVQSRSSPRAERPFALEIAALGATTRSLLLVAAADDAGVLGEVVAAASAMHGHPFTFLDLAPAIEAQLVDVETFTIRFRHPLARSAILAAARVEERAAAHAALAVVLEGQPDRQVWHRAAALSGADEQVARELDAVAARARARGAMGVALEACRRAAQISEDRTLQARRLIQAAEAAFELGNPELVDRLTTEASHHELGVADRVRLALVREACGGPQPKDPIAVLELVGVALYLPRERRRRAGCAVAAARGALVLVDRPGR